MKMTLISIIFFCVIVSIVRASDNVDTNNPLPRHCNYVKDSIVRIYAATLVDGRHLFLIATIQKSGRPEPWLKSTYKVTYVDNNPKHFFQSSVDIPTYVPTIQFIFSAHNLSTKGSDRSQHITYIGLVRI